MTSPSLSAGEGQIMARIDVFHVACVGQALALVLLLPGEVWRSRCDEQVEAAAGSETRERPAVGPDEPRFGPAVPLEPDGQSVARLLA